jgi:hypothetical protein
MACIAIKTYLCDVKYNKEHYDIPMLRGWKPSTSFSREITSKTACSSMWDGNGTCTKMPCTLASSLSSFTKRDGIQFVSYEMKSEKRTFWKGRTFCYNFLLSNSGWVSQDARVEANLLASLFLHANVSGRVGAITNEDDNQTRNRHAIRLELINFFLQLCTDRGRDGGSVDDAIVYTGHVFRID